MRSPRTSRPSTTRSSPSKRGSGRTRSTRWTRRCRLRTSTSSTTSCSTRGSGWCEQIASSLVVLARSAGIPARLATGFVPGDRDALTGRFVVREREAHAWAEIFFPGIGWQGFDPTAAVPLAGDAKAGGSVLSSLRRHAAPLAVVAILLVLRRARGARGPRDGAAAPGAPHVMGRAHVAPSRTRRAEGRPGTRTCRDAAGVCESPGPATRHAGARRGRIHARRGRVLGRGCAAGGASGRGRGANLPLIVLTVKGIL